MISALILTALLNVTDPSHDVTSPEIIPTVHVLGNPDTAVFDVEKLEILEGDTFSFALDMRALDNPWDLPYGFSFPIIEVYLNNHASDANDDIKGALLEGSGMRLADDEAWEYAFKITGDGLIVYRVVNQQAQDVSDTLQASLERQGSRLIIKTQLPMFDDYSLYGVVGSYDPFSQSGWRDLSSYQPDSNTSQLAVLDIIASEADIQAKALQTNTLPRIYPAKRNTGWLRFVVAGISLLATAFLFQIVMALRKRSRQRHAEQPTVTSVMEAQENLSKQRYQNNPEPHAVTTATSKNTATSNNPPQQVAQSSGQVPAIGRAGRGTPLAKPARSHAFGRHVQASFSSESLWVGNGTKSRKGAASATATPSVETAPIIHQAEDIPSQRLRPRMVSSHPLDAVQDVNTNVATTTKMPEASDAPSLRHVEKAYVPPHLQELNDDQVVPSVKVKNTLEVAKAKLPVNKAKRSLPKNTLRPRSNVDDD